MGGTMRRLLLGLVPLMCLCTAAHAETAEDRAGELKTWREQCSDPDADLRLAYLEAALETEDTSIIRLCVRQSLESDNADIRNLGLRAAIASIEQLAFSVEIPKVLADAYEDAGDDSDQLNKISKWYVARDWLSLKTGLVVEIAKADINKGTSVWSPLVNLTRASDNYTGKATIIGDAVTWVGSAYLQRDDCRMALSLRPGPTLEGDLQCGDVTPFHIVANLL